MDRLPSTAKHQPATLSATPLRAEQRYQSAMRKAKRDAVVLDGQGAWIATTGDLKTAAYLARAANSYPKLVAALHLIQASDGFRDGTSVSELQGIARALLRELGEE